ncbi:acyl-CoA dehydrogenase family protein [Streptomyces sp. JJ36]|uniref:acyl-CoA dehydrogenase family protein n=1 Tax=Streptomyces sp. JJ36 TaxID=2736645 RepID=UPI001F1C4259|nr:acyl-CoA dehydrogenase family protein [Streptomyces sp. JJ36]MCF6525449.1 acyl-CoA dehydrogenase [Streptomyces sp. JJ36]
MDAPAPRHSSARVAALEAALGDPRDPASPLGDAAVLAADRRDELPLGGEALLASSGLHREFVPVTLGGRLTGLETVTLLLRAVFRRDAALARGYGSASLTAALFVWCFGTAGQRSATARLLLDGHRIATGAFGSAGLVAAAPDRAGRPGAAGLVLSGRTPALVNAPRAAAFALVPRHAGGSGDSALLLHREHLPSGSVRQLSPYDTGVPRRIPAGELALDRWPVPAGAVVGEAGDGWSVTQRVLQVSRPLGPSMAVGCADTALRTVVAAALAGGGGVRGLRSRFTRRAVAAAFADLLAADCLCLVATRALHLLPDRSSIWSAAARYLVLRLLQEGAGDLMAVLGTDSLREDAGYGTFHRHLRDLAAMPPGQAGSAAALAVLLPQLPTLARRSWTPEGPTAPDGLFLPGGALPPLVPARLKLAAADDPVLALLAAGDAGDARDGADRPGTAVRRVPAALAAELAALRASCRDLPELSPAALANPRGYALAERYALLAAAAACLGVWRAAARAPDGGFLARPAWLRAALGRIALRLGVPGAAAEAGPEEELLDEAVRRCREGRSLDLYATPLGAPARRREKG